MWPEEDGQHGLFYFLDHNCSCLFCRLPAVVTAVDHAQSPGQRDASTLLRPGKVWAFGAECLLRLLATRSEWKNFPHRFIAALVSCLRTKEDVMRFISVSEEYGYHRPHYRPLAG